MENGTGRHDKIVSPKDNNRLVKTVDGGGGAGFQFMRKTLKDTLTRARARLIL